MTKEEKYCQLKERFSCCTNCPLSELRSQVVFGHGNLNADIVVIAEAPGKEEDINGIPLVPHAPAGKNFMRLLDAVGIKRENIWITNTCLCRPVSDKPGKENRTPTAKEIEACEERLVLELNIIKPKVIVLSGNTPLYAIYGKRGITKYRGWQSKPLLIMGKDTQLTIDKVYATIHPASLLYGSEEQRKKKKWWIFEDWKEIAAAI